MKAKRAVKFGGEHREQVGLENPQSGEIGCHATLTGGHERVSGGGRSAVGSTNRLLPAGVDFVWQSSASQNSSRSRPSATTIEKAQAPDKVLRRVPEYGYQVRSVRNWKAAWNASMIWHVGALNEGDQPMQANLFRFLVSAALMGFSVATLAQTVYAIKESDSRTGSSTLVEILRSPIPFDRKYDELTPEQKEVLRSKYDQLGANDEPPFPEEGMAQIGKEIAKLETARKYRGPLIMTVRVDANGEAQSTAVYKTPDDGFAKAIAIVVMKAHYKPAKCDGKPCAMDFPLIFDLGSLP
jgi:hypothetical protein